MRPIRLGHGLVFVRIVRPCGDGNLAVVHDDAGEAGLFAVELVAQTAFQHAVLQSRPVALVFESLFNSGQHVDLAHREPPPLSLSMRPRAGTPALGRGA